MLEEKEHNHVVVFVCGFRKDFRGDGLVIATLGEKFNQRTNTTRHEGFFANITRVSHAGGSGQARGSWTNRTSTLLLLLLLSARK